MRAQAQHWEVIDQGKVVVSTSAEELWECAVSYFQWCDENPIQTKMMAKSGKTQGSSYTAESTRPYTASGLCLHLGIPEEYFNDILQSKDKTSLYYQVVNNIKNIIKTQNLEMGLIGVYNPIIVSKVLNLERDEAPMKPVEMKNVKGVISNGEYIELPELATSENEILEKLKSEFQESKNTKEQ